MTKVLFIDHREKSGLEVLVQKYCEKNSLQYQIRENLITDYAFASADSVGNDRQLHLSSEEER